ncbi:MAG TPA: chemotaxis protein CheC [Candidatus Thermoplasmatota archaeon]|nr:chemotaxis protein CheC [Candidatus Thermoplasmatota archaeon]
MTQRHRYNPPMHTEAEADALRELGNVAFSHAATALSGLVGKRVDISLPSVRIVPTTEVEGGGSGPDEPLFIVTLRILGDQQGLLALIFGQNDALTLTEMLEGVPHGTRTTFTPAAEGILTEVANIMCGSALLAMYRMLRISLVHSVPMIRLRGLSARETNEPLGSIEGDLAILVDAEFSVENRVSHGKMVISLHDLQYFLDALNMYQDGGST